MFVKPWTSKYEPKAIGEIFGQDEAITKIKQFIENHKKGKSILIYGPPGSGKTSTVHVLAREYDLELVELNASDTRNKKTIKELLESVTSQQSLFSRGKLVLIDEIDGVSGSADRGGVPELVKIIGSSPYPIIMTANNPFRKNLSSLRRKSKLIEFKTVAYSHIITKLKTIAEKEDIDLDNANISMIAHSSGGDLRAAINDFQSLDFKKINSQNELTGLSERKGTLPILLAITRIFKTTNPKIAMEAVDDIEEDYNTVLLWIDENLPIEYKKNLDLKRAYDCLSSADVYNGRIIRRQYWGFLPLIKSFLTAGIALSKYEKYVNGVIYNEPKRILKMWIIKQKNAKREAILSKISDKTHTSKKKVLRDTYPYIKYMFEQSSTEIDSISDYFELDKEEIKYLRLKK